MDMNMTGMTSQADGTDAISVAVPHYDEEEAELFTGPGFPGYSDEEEPEGDEYYEGDEDENAHAYPDLNVSSFEQSAAQRAYPYEEAQAGIASDYIQLGAAHEMLYNQPMMVRFLEKGTLNLRAHHMPASNPVQEIPIHRTQCMFNGNRGQFNLYILELLIPM